MLLFRPSKESPYITMNESNFWEILRSVKISEQNANETLRALLSNLSHNEIKEFDTIYTEKLKLLWHWDNWAVAFIICGCNTEYDFLDFCNWCLLQGEEYNNRLSNKPDELYDYNFPLKDNLPYPYVDEFDLVPGLLYEELTGQELPYHQVVNFQPKGKRFKNKPKSLKESYPNLFNKFWSKN